MMGSVRFTVELTELDGLARQLGGIHSTFSQMPEHQPVDYGAIGEAGLAYEYGECLNGWHVGRRKIDTEIQVVIKHVKNALHEYTVAENTISQAQADLVTPGSGVGGGGVADGAGLAAALASSGRVGSAVAAGVAVEDPTFVATQGLASAVVSATDYAANTDAAVRRDTSEGGLLLGPVDHTEAQAVDRAVNEAYEIDRAVDSGVGGGPDWDDGIVPTPQPGPPRLIHHPILVRSTPLHIAGTTASPMSPVDSSSTTGGTEL